MRSQYADISLFPSSLLVCVRKGSHCTAHFALVQLAIYRFDKFSSEMCIQ